MHTLGPSASIDCHSNESLIFVGRDVSSSIPYYGIFFFVPWLQSLSFHWCDEDNYIDWCKCQGIKLFTKC